MLRMPRGIQHCTKSQIWPFEKKILKSALNAHGEGGAYNAPNAPGHSTLNALKVKYGLLKKNVKKCIKCSR